MPFPPWQPLSSSHKTDGSFSRSIGFLIWFCCEPPHHETIQGNPIDTIKYRQPNNFYRNLEFNREIHSNQSQKLINLSDQFQDATNKEDLGVSLTNTDGLSQHGI